MLLGIMSCRKRYVQSCVRYMRGGLALGNTTVIVFFEASLALDINAGVSPACIHSRIM